MAVADMTTILTELYNFRKKLVLLLFIVIMQLLGIQAKAQSSTSDLIKECRYWGTTNQAKIGACSKLFEQGETYKWLFFVYGKLLDKTANFDGARDVYMKGSKLFPKDKELRSLLKISQSKAKELKWKRQSINRSGSVIASQEVNNIELQIRCQLVKDSGLALPAECKSALKQNNSNKFVQQEVKVTGLSRNDQEDMNDVIFNEGELTLDESPVKDSRKISSELNSLKEEISKLKQQLEVSQEKFVLPDKRRRVALVIGNAMYKHVGPLVNTLNDAREVGKVLRETGFNVTVRTDVQDSTEFIELIRQYYKDLAKDKQTVGLFYYAGHAVQVDGVNYLIPVDSDIQNKADLSRTALSLSYVSDIAAEANNTMNMFVVDACRNNPFRSLSRSIQGGLANVRAPEGSLIVYAAGPGRVAMDGDGNNSPFTKNLIKHLDTPNKHVLLMLQDVIKDVREETQGFQQPWVQSSLSGDFYFKVQ